MSTIIQSDNPEFPIVKVTDAVMERAGGHVDVDLEGINELLRDDLGLERDVTPRYTLYGRYRFAPVQGLHVPYTHTAFVQLPSTLERGLLSPATTLIHESVHLVDSIQHPVRTAGEIGLRGLAHMASLAVARKVYENMPGPEVTDVAARTLTFWQLRFGLYYGKLDPSENRARASEHDADLLTKYQDIIRIGRRVGRSSLLDW